MAGNGGSNAAGSAIKIRYEISACRANAEIRFADGNQSTAAERQ